jgi:hypothetical protein
VLVAMAKVAVVDVAKAAMVEGMANCHTAHLSKCSALLGTLSAP